MTVVDTHCHLDMVKKKGIAPAEALRRARERGVSALVQIAVDLKSSRRNREWVQELQPLPEGLEYYWTAGIHPEGADDLSGLEETLALIRECRDEPGFLGVGETGLDYFHTREFIANQKESFARHLEIARELNLPVVLHLRDAREYDPSNIQTVTDALDMIREVGGVKGVLHCFTYSYEEAAPFVDMGWFVSFSGILTYRNAEILRKTAVQLPLDVLLTETDAPYLSPMPERGKTNEPAFVAHTLEFLANLRAERLGENAEEVKARIHGNALKFLNWKNES